MIMPNWEKIPQSSEKYIKKHFPDFYEYLMSLFPDSPNFTEKKYRFINNIQSRPVCDSCGAPVQFVDGYTGYRHFCCRRCADKDPNHLQKTTATCLQKYGVTHQNKNKSIIEKSRNTRIKNCGSLHESYKISSEKSRNTRIKNCGSLHESYANANLIFIKTCMAKYGVSNPSQVEIFKRKARETCLQKYGAEYPLQSDEVKKKIQNSRRKTIIYSHPDVIDILDSGEWVCKCPHPGCCKCHEKTYSIFSNYYLDRCRDNTELCTHLLPIKQSHSTGTTIEIFVRNILDRHNIKYETNVKYILGGKELDIYIPSKHIAIECNGIYWHSKKEAKYHINKYELCKSMGIQLLTIWEDWIITKPNIIESIILTKLGKTPNRYYARKCNVVKLSTSIGNSFLQNNHIQGQVRRGIYYGLEYNNELVSVMVFAKRSKLSGPNILYDNEWELVRFCNKLNTVVVGGASKLIKHFIENYNPDKIISFSSNDISDGGLYRTLGFESENKSSIAYWYVQQKTFKRYHRTSFTKKSLIKKGYDANSTEEEIMKGLNYFKIYDSGHTKHVLNCTS